jgi:ubiquinone/menaquinone biosynthesis C-methylase UbiE
MEYLYQKFAKYYDLCYIDKDYNKETNFLQTLIKKHKIKGEKILEVGCGTGGHAVYLKRKNFDIVGIDLHKEMLEVAKKKSKSIKFLQGDMRDFDLGEKFSILLCLFSTIHYNQNLKELKKTLVNFYKHLKSEGILIFDMGFNDERWKGGNVHLGNWANKDVDLVRFSKSRRERNFGLVNMAYILFKNKKFYFGEEEHKLRIFKTFEVKKLAEKIGFKVYLYDGYTTKSWRKNSNKYVVFACVKS